MGQRGFFSLSVPPSKAVACRIHKSQKLPKVPFSTEHSTLGWHQFTQKNFRAEPLSRFPPRQCGMSQESGRAKSPHRRTPGTVQACAIPILKLEDPQLPWARPTCIDKRTLFSSFSSCCDCKLMVASTGKATEKEKA